MTLLTTTTVKTETATNTKKEPVQMVIDREGYTISLINGEWSVEIKPTAKGKVGAYTPLMAYQHNKNILDRKVYGLYAHNDNEKEADPYLAFSEKSGKAKFSEKKISPLVNIVGVDNPSLGVTESSLLSLRYSVSNHYGINVGTGYGVASTLTFISLIERMAFLLNPNGETRNNLKEVLDAQPRAWEHIYEDMALAGYNQPGYEFYQALQVCVSGKHKKDGVSLSWKETMCFLQDAYAEATKAKKVDEVWTDAQRDAIIPIDLMDRILEGFRITRGYSALARLSPEKFPKHLGAMKAENDLFVQVVICGALRSLGRGDYGAGGLTVMDEAIHDGGMGTSPWTLLAREDYWAAASSQLPNWLKYRLAAGVVVNKELAKFDLKKAAQEEGGGSGRVNYAPNEETEEVPYIDVHNSSISQDDDYPTTREGDLWKFGPKGIVESYKTLMGAFEHKLFYNPVIVVKELDEESGKVVRKMVRDDSVAVTAKDPSGCLYTVRPLSPREIMERAALRYPNGAWLESRGDDSKSSQIIQYMDFKSLLKLGAFVNGGGATGLTLTAVEIMISCSMKVASRGNGWETDIRSKLQGFGGMSRKWIQKSSKKKLGQGPKCRVAAKVATSHSIRVAPVDMVVTNVDGTKETIWLPVVCMNPDDEGARLLGVEEFSFVSFGRSPMIYRGMALLIFSREVAIGSIEVDAATWAEFNRGDGDGDPADIEATEKLWMEVYYPEH